MVSLTTPISIQYEVGDGEKLLNEAWQTPTKRDDLKRLHSCYQEYPYLVTIGTCNEASSMSSDNPFSKYAIKAHDSMVGLAYNEGRIIGIVAGKALKFGPDRYKDAYSGKELPQDEFRVTHCIVAPEFRGKGVATELYVRLRVAIKETGEYKTISVSVIDKPEDPNLPNLWKKRFGYQQIGSYETKWVDLGQTAETPHKMDLYVESLNARA